MDALEAAKIAQAALDDKLGQDIQVLNLKGLSNVADCFVIASGKNVNHLRAMADEVEQKLFQAGVKNFLPYPLLTDFSAQSALKIRHFSLIY